MYLQNPELSVHLVIGQCYQGEHLWLRTITSPVRWEQNIKESLNMSETKLQFLRDV